MTYFTRPLLLALLPLMALSTAACDGIITEEGTPPEPVFKVIAEANGALAIDGDPRGALAWTVYDPSIAECLNEVEVDGPLDLQNDADWVIANALQRCYFFSERGRVETDSVAIETAFPATFEINVESLPDPAYLSGQDGSRIGFADIYIYIDGNGNNQFDETPRGALFYLDKLVGTSRPISDEALSYSFIVYREGELSPIWKLFTALYQCEDPAPGFSTVTISNLDELAPNCVVDQRAVDVSLYDDGAAASLACAPDQLASEVQRPREDDPLPAGTTMLCADGQFGGRALFTTDEIESVCPTIREYSLFGCSDLTNESTCRATSWDIENAEPTWWPCGSISALFYSSFSEEFATDGLDTLATFTWGEGPGQLPLDSLHVVIELGPDSEIEIAGADLDFQDNDNNGVFNTGDLLTVVEPSNLFTNDSAPGLYTVSLFSDIDIEVRNQRGDWLGITAYAPVPLPAVPQVTLSGADALAPIALGASDIATFEYEGEGPAFVIETMSAYAYIGGELPVNFSQGQLTLVDDVNQDGLFGPGDTLLIRDSIELYSDVTPEVIQSFGGLLYFDIRTEYAFNASGTVASVAVEVF